MVLLAGLLRAESLARDTEEWLWRAVVVPPPIRRRWLGCVFPDRGACPFARGAWASWFFEVWVVLVTSGCGATLVATKPGPCERAALILGTLARTERGKAVTILVTREGAARCCC